MTFLRFLFGVASLLAVMVGVVGGLTGMGAPFYLWALVVACVASMAWGLVVKLQDERGDMTEYREQVWARREGELDEDELPYRAPVVTETVYRSPLEWQHIEGGKRALWPNEIGGVE